MLASLVLAGSCKRNGTACGRMEYSRPDSGQISVARNDSAPAPRIHIDYLERAEGYTVSADVFPGRWPDCCHGSVRLHFVKDADAFDVLVEDLDLLDYLDRDSTCADGRSIVRHYSPAPHADSLSWEHPFFFYDVDFDGEKEVVVASHGDGPQGSIAYHVFETTGELRDDEPFGRIDSQSRLDAREKSVTQNYCYGMLFGDVILKYVRQADGAFLLTDSTHVDYLPDSEECIRRHYRRKGDEMVLVDSTRVTK